MDVLNVTGSNIVSIRNLIIIRWISTVYLTMGLIYSLLSGAVEVMLKNFGLGNQVIATLTSLLILPYVLKPFIAPFLEFGFSKTAYIRVCQFSMAFLFFLIAVNVIDIRSIGAVYIILLLVAILGSVQDISTDGFSLTELSKPEQALFSSYMAVCWCVGAFVSSGLLVSISGYLHQTLLMEWLYAWRIIFAVVSFYLLVIALYHSFFLPADGLRKKAISEPDSLSKLRINITSFFEKPGVGTIILFIFFFRFSEGMSDRLVPLFFLDDLSVGGLGLSNIEVGTIFGSAGLIAFLAGNILGGLTVFKLGLKRCIFPMCLIANLPHLAYCFLALNSESSLLSVTSVVVFEKFMFGIGVPAQMIFMMTYLGDGEFRMSHFAFGTGIMAFSIFLSGIFGGLIQSIFGYKLFFMFMLIPTVCAIYFSYFVTATTAASRN